MCSDSADQAAMRDLQLGIKTAGQANRDYQLGQSCPWPALQRPADRLPRGLWPHAGLNHQAFTPSYLQTGLIAIRRQRMCLASFQDRLVLLIEGSLNEDHD
ncbi:MAG: hypothetical protein IT423_15160 [Pirellulaceae bacterium]|nr:hypothetical protein [Pirellulaceae bacterium]